MANPIHSACQVAGPGVVSFRRRRTPGLSNGNGVGRREGLALVGGCAGELDYFVRLLRKPEEAAAEQYVCGLVRSGYPVGSLYLGLLTQAARHLGDLWADDRCNFFEVTVGVGRIQRLVGRIRPEFELAQEAPERRAFFLSVPGEQHTLGLLILAEFFERGGWSVDLGPPFGPVSLDEVERVPYDLVGFSVSRADTLEAVTCAIKRVRARSANPAVRVLVGGNVFLDNPALAERVGADGTAADAELASLTCAGVSERADRHVGGGVRHH